MKIINIKFNDYLANWIIGSAQKNRVTISAFIRDLLAEQMQEGPVVVKNINKAKQFAYNQTYRNEMGYIIFTAKLLEKLVLSQDQGEMLRDTAFEQANNLLEELNLNNKEQRFCIKLEHDLFTWLNSEAERLQLKFPTLIRNLIADRFMQTSTAKKIELSIAQKFAIKHQIKAYNLLETLVKKTTEDGASIIEEAQAKAQNIFSQIFLE